MSIRTLKVGRTLALSCGVAAALATHVAKAQTAAPPPDSGASAPAAAAGATKLEAVTVTARKRAEQLQDVPISVQSFSEKELRDAGVYDLQDLKKSSGFTLHQSGGTAAGGRTLGNITFRGLQGDSGFLPNESSGGLFVDGIYISAGVGSVNARDVARVEVLKGPQNAFFGRNTFGGAINFITRNPSDTFRGEVNSSFTHIGSSDVDATLEGPLVAEVLKGRITVLSHRKAAPYRASDGGDLGAEKTQSVSSTLYFTPTEDLWMRLRGHYQQDDDSMPAVGYIPARGDSSCNGQFFNGTTNDGTPAPFTPYRPAANAFYICGSLPRLGEGASILDANTSLPAGALPAFRDSNSLNDPVRGRTPDLDHAGLRRDITRASYQLGYQLPYDAEFQFNAGYNEAKSTSIWDLDRSTSLNYLNLLALAVKDLTLDARLSSNQKLPLRGLLGVSYFTQRYRFAQLNYNNYATATRDPNNAIDDESKVPAFYGSVEYDILSNLTLSGDVRRQKDTITSYAFNNTATFQNSVKNWLPRVSLRFKPNDDTTLYASWARGVQQLATNVGYINAGPAVRAYIESQVPGSSEYTPQPKLDSFEVGVKQSLLDNRLRYALALYNQKWENRLTNTVLLCPPGQAGTPACPLTASGTSVAFGNEATIRGVELAIEAAPTANWAFGAYLDYKRARWDSYYSGSFGAITGVTPPRAVRFDGNTLARIPDFTGAVNATFRAPVAANWSGYVRGDVVYTGRAWESDMNIIRTDDFFRVDLRTGIERKDTTVELFVKNLFNDNHWDYAQRLADLSGPYPGYFTQGFLVTPPPRREVGLRLRYAFE